MCGGVVGGKWASWTWCVRVGGEGRGGGSCGIIITWCGVWAVWDAMGLSPPHRDVGEEHELLDERVCLFELVHLHVQRVLALRVQHELHLNEREERGQTREEGGGRG